MPDISKMKFPGDNKTYYVKDSEATRGFYLSQSSIPHEYYVNFIDANGFVRYQRHLYLWFDGNTLQLGDLTDGDTVYASIEVPEVKIEFEPNLVTPTECWLKVKVGGAEIDSHWLLWTRDGSDLVLKDYDHNVDIFRIPVSMFQ